MSDLPPFDPKLKQAVIEINEVLKKHDIGGFIALASPTHGEYCLKIETSWSCAYLQNENRVRFRAMKAEYPSVEARDKAMEETVHLMLQIRDLCAQGFTFGDLLIKELSNHMEITHTPYAHFTPHTET